jgi:outer membrane protein TolC
MAMPTRNRTFFPRFQAALFRAGGIAAFVLILLSPLQAQILTLDKAVEIAFKNSPSIQEARFNLTISGENLKAQQAGLKSQFLLTLTPLTLSQTRTFSDLTSRYNTQELTRSALRFSITQPIKWTDGTLTLVDSFNWQKAASSYTGLISEATFNNSLTLRLTQPIFTYNRTQMTIRQLELSLENSQINYALQKLSIERQVTQQFLNLYASWESLKIAEEELKNATESYQIIESKVKAGISAPVELYQADLTRLSSVAGLENKQMSYQNSLDSFKVLLGLPLTEEIEIVADIRKKLVEVSLDKAVEHAQANRMELRQRDITIRNALDSLIRVEAENEFKGSIDVSLGLTGVNKQIQNIYESSNTDKQIAVSFNIPVFDWGQKTHRIAASQASIDTQRLSAGELRKQITLEIRQAYRNLQNQTRQIEIAEINVQNAQRTYEINLERYKNGDLSSKDIQFYQLQLSQQKLNEVQALISYKLTVLDLKIRSLFDFENNRSIVDLI